MSKKFGLFGDSDLFLARKLKPLMDQTKMRKFQGSKYIAGCLVAVTLFLPYWIYKQKFGQQIIIQYDVNHTKQDSSEIVKQERLK